MRDQPSGAELLAAAQKVMRERILAILPADRKHEALMIANAMSIAARQLEQGEAPERAELQALSGLCELAPVEAGNPQALRAALVEANRALAHAIRAGAAVPGQTQRSAILAHLRQVARQRVQESNPKYLKA